MKSGFATLLALTALWLTAVSGHAAAPHYFPVNSTADEADGNVGDGKCKTANKKCTLRAAIQGANAGFKDHSYRQNSRRPSFARDTHITGRCMRAALTGVSRQGRKSLQSSREIHI